jgi:hypothetical protein
MTVAGAATALALIGTSLTGFDRHVFGWESWPGPGPVDIASQVLPGLHDGAPKTKVLKVRQSARGPIVIPASIPARALAGDRRGGATITGTSEVVSLRDGAKGGAQGEAAGTDKGAGTPTAAFGSNGPSGDNVTSGVPEYVQAPDSDNDGLSAATEKTIGTDPNKWDTDGDGLPDGWEASHRLDPLSATDATSDPDHDGLANKTEYRTMTDPQAAETDAGVPDGSQDFDHDGVPNAVEEDLGTKPEVTDSSGTGVDDGAADADGDGFSNAEEVTAGTDPADPASHPGDTVAPKPPQTDPAPVDPGSAPVTDPAVDDTTVGPKPTDPAPVDPGANDPGTGTPDPAPADPAPADPGPVDPGPTTDPVPTATPEPTDPAPAGDPAPAAADPGATPSSDEPECDGDADDPASCAAPATP